MDKVKNVLKRISLWAMGAVLSLGVFGAALSGTALTAKAAAPTEYTTITERGSATATIDTAYGQEYFRFVPSKSGNYMFYSMGSFDTFGYLYNASGAQLAMDDEGGEGNNFSLTYYLNANTTYYYGVSILSATTGNVSVYMSDCLDEDNYHFSVSTAQSQLYQVFNSGRAVGARPKSVAGEGGTISYNYDETSLNNNNNDMFGRMNKAGCKQTFRVGRSFTINQETTETASVTFNCYDVDSPQGEVDTVYLVDEADRSNRQSLGTLSGMDESWNTTTLNISPELLKRGHTYYLEISIASSGNPGASWYVFVRTVSLQINGGTTAKMEGALSASISDRRLVTVDLELQGTETATYDLEFKAVELSTMYQRGQLLNNTISVTTSKQHYTYQFSLENAAKPGTYEITVYVKNGEAVLFTKSTSAGYSARSVSYDPNGGSNNFPTDTTAYASGNNVEVLFNAIPSRAGYIFLGWAEDRNALKPTYTQDGNKSFVIGDSDVVLYAIWIDENHEHTGNWRTILPATCTTDGIEEVDCTSCGEVGYRAIPALGHTWMETNRVAEDCTTDGYIEYVCACGATKQDVIPAHGHVWDYEVVYHNPTCTEDGYWDVLCELCDAVETVIDPNTATGHTYDNSTMVIEATCTTPGIMRYSCVNGCAHYYEVFVEADHSAYIYEDSRVEATCETDGVIYYVCGACGHETQEVIEAKGHNYTYTDNGNGTHRVYCNTCRTSYNEAHDTTRRVCVCGYKNNAYIDVLLIQDNAPWSTASNENILNSLKTQGYIDNWNKCTTSDILKGNVTFESYSLILFANDQTDYTYGNYAHFADELATYVENGGALVFGACDEGWRGGSLSAALPGGVTTSFKLDRNNRITDTDNDIVLGTYTDGVALENDDLVSSYCSHVYFNNIPGNANVVFENTDGNATLIEYALGDGYVIATGLTWEYSVVHCSYADFADIAYDDMIVAALSQVGAYAYEKYLVEFVDFDGTLINAQRIERGESPAAPAIPTREGYTFIGWDTTNDGTVDYLGNMPAIYADVQFVAVYKINQYNVALAVEGNGVASGEGTFTYGETTVLKATAAQGSVFAGWILDGVCLSMDENYVYTVGASNVEIVASFRNKAIGAEVSITTDKPAYMQGETIIVTLTLQNITETSGISAIILNQLLCNGSAVSVMQVNENARLVNARYVGTASGWSASVSMSSITVSGPAVTQDGAIAVELSIIITAQRDSDLTFEVVGSGKNGNGEACEIKFTTLTIGVTCAHTSTHIENAVDPTCTQKGYTGDVVCNDCGNVTAGDEIDVVAHNYVFFCDGVEATCTTSGYYYEKCSDCIAVRQVEIPTAGNHDVAVEYGYAATCTETGLTDKEYCARCGEVFVAAEVIPALGHDEAIDYGYAATCTETGLTDEVYCAVCGDVLVAAEVIPALGHDEAIDYGYAATCTETGLTDEVYCAVCGDVLVAAEIIPALGHSEAIDYGYAATCTETGLTDEVYCAVCGDVLVAAEIIPALGHSEAIEYGYAATCTETGLTDKVYCTVCGDVLVAAEVIPALGHSGAIHAGYAATCTETGLTDEEYCAVCGEVLVAAVAIPATGHNIVPFEGAPATCTENGWSYGEHCSVCFEITVEPIMVPALGHDICEIDACPATCTSDGCTYGKYCARCHEEFVVSETIPALGHNVTIVPGYAATCTNDGLTDGEYCDVCDTWLVEQVKIPAGHVASEWIPMEYDQFDRVSKEKIVCTVCGEQLDVRIPAPEHSGEVIVEARKATCEESGWTIGVYCEDCDTWVIAQEEIPALGHKATNWTAVYDKNGKVVYEEKTCAVCGTQLDVRIPADNDNNNNNGNNNNNNNGNNNNNNGNDYGNGYGNGGGVDIYDNEVNVGEMNVGCSGTVGMVSILPCAAFLSGLMIRRKKISMDAEDADNE